MTRTGMVTTIVGMALCAGAVGGVLGMLYAPASGKELRRRLAWRADEEWRCAARASRKFIGRVVERTRAELENFGEHVPDMAAH